MPADYKTDHRLLIALHAMQGLTMASFAMLAPSRLADMSPLHDLVQHMRHWLPHVHALASRSAISDLAEVFILLSPIIVAVSFIVYIVFRPSGSQGPPFESWVVKALGVLLFGMLIFLTSSFYWSGFLANATAGLLSGRGGAAMQVMLSGRLGLATVGTFLFGLFPLALLCTTWIFIRKPVHSTI